ncbi:hypothetical protein [Neobacillus jeddahensis]|uniref:hypothetical protein n=1 Tax=Neobacillus jeddahensis TaxID=1461580 RepID=UPI00058BEB0F|nr:hypothetical protein [Neobacillus jeddahensis]
MKKVIGPFLAAIILISGCQNSEPKASDVKKPLSEPKQMIETKSGSTTFPYPNLLATQEQTYSLLAIGEQDEQSPIEENQNVIENVKNILSLPTQEIAQKAFPELQLNNMAYILFNQTGIVHQSKNLKELTRFLQEHPPK